MADVEEGRCVFAVRWTLVLPLNGGKSDVPNRRKRTNAKLRLSVEDDILKDRNDGRCDSEDVEECLNF